MTGKGVLEMQLKDKTGAWKTFYPGDLIYPGFYSIPAPNVSNGGIRILVNGKELEKK